MVQLAVTADSESADPGVKSFVILATMGDALVEAGGFEATVASGTNAGGFFGFLTSMGVPTWAVGILFLIIFGITLLGLFSLRNRGLDQISEDERLVPAGSALNQGDFQQRMSAALDTGQVNESLVSGGVSQAEIDAACELIDFWRFNCHYARGFHDQLQPLVSPDGVVNSTEIRPLEGFVLAITPFNFSSIAANLPSAPAIVGCTSVWKPSRNSYHSNYVLMRLMMEAGLPPGVINFVPSSGPTISRMALSNPDFAGLHFTGSTSTFQGLWKRIGESLDGLRSYPRIVGETGGKDFIVAHPECDEQGLIVALLRGAFEYQGQKCSAASRAYIPESVWARISEPLAKEISKIKMGDASDFTNFMTAVIDQRAFDKITGYIDRARERETCDVFVGGGSDDSTGWFIEPTIIVTQDSRSETMVEEIFGPVLCITTYSNEEEAIELANDSEYGLSGGVWSGNEDRAMKVARKLRTGQVSINGGAFNVTAPFGGYKKSGLGRELGVHGMEEFLETKSIQR